MASRISDPVLRVIARVCKFVSLGCVCATNLGWRSAYSVLLLSRWSTAPRTITLKRLNRPFTFRGRADYGVMSHFFTPGYRILDAPSNPVRTIIDAGANIGDETVRFRHFHPEARIVAVEAEPGNFALLSKNCGEDEKIVLVNQGLWSVSTRLKIVSHSASNEGFSVTEDTDGTGTIDAISIAQIMDSQQWTHIDILKLDIEGSEYEVFARNSAGWVGKVNCLIFECPDRERPGSTAAIFRAVDSENFDCYVHGENIVLIRRSTGWRLQSVLDYSRT